MFNNHFEIYMTPIKTIDKQRPIDSGTNIKPASLIRCSYDLNSEKSDKANSNIKAETFFKKIPFENYEQTSLTKIVKGDNSKDSSAKEESSPAPKTFLNSKRNLFAVFESVKTPKFHRTPKKVFHKKNLFELSSHETLYSSDKKKSRKRLRKNKTQIEVLNNFYDSQKGKWTRLEIRELSKTIGIKETKVYKWLWDRKAKDEKKKKFVLTTEIKTAKLVNEEK